MAGAWAEREQAIWNIIACVLVSLCLLGITARVYIRVHLRGSVLTLVSWHWSDIFLVLAFLGFLSSTILQFISIVHYKFASYNWGSTAKTREDYVVVRKMQYAWNVLQWCWLFLVKASLLCFFDELVERWTHPRMWWGIRVVGIVVGMSFVAVLVYGAAWCQPISRQWANDLTFCWFEFDDKFRMNTFRQVLHATTDVIVILIPLPLLPQINNIPIRQRLGVAIMFLLGLFCTISSLFYLHGCLQGWDDGNRHPSYAATRFWEFEPLVELAAAILIQCVPAMRVFFTRYRKRRNRDRHVSEMVDPGCVVDGGGDMEALRLSEIVGPVMKTNDVSVDTKDLSDVNVDERGNLADMSKEASGPSDITSLGGSSRSYRI